MEINKREEIIELYDIYGLLLTDKQRMYFEEYYFMDLSLQEIADNYEISKNGVFDQIKRTIHTLELYEEKLMIRKKIEKALFFLNFNAKRFYLYYYKKGTHIL